MLFFLFEYGLMMFSYVFINKSVKFVPLYNKINLSSKYLALENINGHHFVTYKLKCTQFNKTIFVIYVIDNKISSGVIFVGEKAQNS